MKRIILVVAIICGSSKSHAALRINETISQNEAVIAAIRGKDLSRISIDELKLTEKALSSGIRELNTMLDICRGLSLKLNMLKTRLTDYPATTPEDIEKKGRVTQESALQEVKLCTEISDIPSLLEELKTYAEKIKQELHARLQ